MTMNYMLELWLTVMINNEPRHLLENLEGNKPYLMMKTQSVSQDDHQEVETC